jgi:hypothetical protein
MDDSLYAYELVGVARVADKGRRSFGGDGAAIVIDLPCLECALLMDLFGQHQMRLALVEMGVLWLVVAATLSTFGRVHPQAGPLLISHLPWIGKLSVEGEIR